MIKHLYNSLRLVFPPVSNQEASWLWNDKEVRKFIQASKLYFIAQREELFFKNFYLNDNQCDVQGNHCAVIDTTEDVCVCTLRFDIEGNNHKEFGISFSFEFDSDLSILIELGKKIIRITDSKNGEVLGWWTPDKLLFENWRGVLEVEGLEHPQKFTRYQLHYVGISKEEDSFTRLFKRGHQKRAKILTDETQIVESARLSDELMIFFFDVEELGIKSIGGDCTEDELSEFIQGICNPKDIEKSKLIADAEKAFVSLLDCKYNEVKYKNYPKSEDGLYTEQLTGYGFQISENLTFITDTTEFVGDLNYISGLAGDKADLIAIEGNNVKFMKAGKSK